MRLDIGALLVATALAAACSSSSSTGSSSGASSGTPWAGSSGGNGGCCTINAQSYSCPDEGSFSKCADTAHPDASGCSKTASCGGGSSSSGSSSSSKACCSINGNAWDCPGSDALIQCAKGNPSACTARSTDCP